MTEGIETRAHAAYPADISVSTWEAPTCPRRPSPRLTLPADLVTLTQAKELVKHPDDGKKWSRTRTRQVGWIRKVNYGVGRSRAPMRFAPFIRILCAASISYGLTALFGASSDNTDARPARSPTEFEASMDLRNGRRCSI